MFQSKAMRFLLIGLLTILMVIPLFLVSLVVNERRFYQGQAERRVSDEWGRSQTLVGPELEAVYYQFIESSKTFRTKPELDSYVRLNKRDARGLAPRVTEITVQEVDSKTDTIIEKTNYFIEFWVKEENIFFALPKQLTANVNAETELRTVGIYDIPVYSAALDWRFRFATDEIAQGLARDYRLDLEKLNSDWGVDYTRAKLNFRISENRVLRGEASLVQNGKTLNLDPLPSQDDYIGGFYANIDALNDDEFQLNLKLNGTKSFRLSPVAYLSDITISSDWPDPKFMGGFLPDSYENDGKGFTARYQIPQIARELPQLSETDVLNSAYEMLNFGVDFIQPNDFYQKSSRAAKYSILFVGLVFLSIFLLEARAARRVNGVQYILVGLVQSIFFLLLVAYAEQFGFARAYLGAAFATIALIGLYGLGGLKLGAKGALVLVAELLVVYIVLYVIIQSADYALLIGSTLLFMVMAVVMFVTRNETWQTNLPKREKKLEKRAAQRGEAYEPTLVADDIVDRPDAT